MADAPETDFGDLDDFLTVQVKELLIHGKTYIFPGEVSGRAWLLIQRTMSEGERAQRARERGQAYEARRIILSDEDEADLRVEVFGDTEAELVADGVGSQALQRIFLTLMAWHAFGRDSALAIWRDRGEAPAPNRATRRASRPASSVGAATTRTSTSGSGTRASSTSRSRKAS